MPTYRSITISITSQFDICQLPEYAPPTSTDDPFSTHPTLLSPDRSLVTVYIPTYPSSQFWLRYSIAPPYPPKAIYYFKLFLNGNCVVSWGCGEEDGYRGKTVFGLYDSGANWAGDSTIERRMICFSGSENPDDVMEIKVYRAKGKQRITPELQDYKALMPSRGGGTPRSRMNGNEGISLIKAGYLTREHPKRFYNYALLDPLDKPFASFRYFPRTWDQLVALGVASPTPSTQSSPQVQSIKQPSRKASDLTTSSSQSNSSSSSSSVNTRKATVAGTAKAVTLSPPSHAIFRPRLSRPLSAPENSPTKINQVTRHASERQLANNAITAPSLISLSPPHDKTVTQARFASLIRRGTRSRTPSPQKNSVREQVPTPSPTRDSPTRDLGSLPPPLPTPDFTTGPNDNARPRPRRSGSMGLLMNAVSSAVNRKAKAASGAVVEGSPVGTTLVLQAMQSESEDNASTMDAESKDSFSMREVDGNNEDSTEAVRGAEIEQENRIIHEEQASVESATPSAHRSRSESESDTSSKRAAKERKGFLKFNLLRKKVEAERSASSTPDAEIDNQDSSGTVSKKWRSWGRKGVPQEVREQQAKALLETM